MPDLDSQAKGRDRGRDGDSTHSFHGMEQTPGEPESVKQSKAERDCQPGRTTPARGREQALQGNKDNTRCYHRFHDPIGNPDHIEDRERQSDGMRDSESSYYLEQVPQTG